jgi:mitochondrial import inner membrane translocase subunit TIM21
VKSDSRCIELLGRPASKIKAYGEPTSNKWARARPLAHTIEVDKFGTMHFRMHFHVEGTEAKGVVYVHMTKPKDEKELIYEVLSLNVPGEPVVYLENRAGEGGVKGKVGKMFGVQWR